jgi:hypothetical protein
VKCVRQRAREGRHVPDIQLSCECPDGFVHIRSDLHVCAARARDEKYRKSHAPIHDCKTSWRSRKFLHSQAPTMPDRALSGERGTAVIAVFRRPRDSVVSLSGQRRRATQHSAACPRRTPTARRLLRRRSRRKRTVSTQGSIVQTRTLLSAESGGDSPVGKASK